MSFTIQSKTKIQLGVVPTHLKFVGGLVPDDNGRLPRDKHGNLIVVANLKSLGEQSKVRIDCVQIPSFPGLNDNDVAELVGKLKELGLAVHYILMVGGADPMNLADENAVVEMLVGGLRSAEKHGIASVSFEYLRHSLQVQGRFGGSVRVYEQPLPPHPCDTFHK